MSHQDPLCAIDRERVFDYDPELSSHPAVPPRSNALLQNGNGGGKNLISKIERALDWTFRALMVTTGLALAFLMFAQVIMRYILESSFTGIEEVAVLLGVWIYFLGMGYATRVHEHIHGGVISLIVSDPLKLGVIRFAGSIISMIAACIFGYFACKYALFVIDKGRLSINLQWPRGLWSGSMIVGFSMMAGYFFLDAANQFIAIRALRRNQT
ncbi:MAG: TRAP transporter small permease subunit [Motiliproteus sp.]